MKKIFIAITVMFAAVAFTSCNQNLLNIQQKGAVSQEEFYQTLDVNYGNVSPIITNKISNRQMICYRLKSFNNAKFTSESQLQVGDIVVVYGKIQNRYGVPQLTQGCYLVTSDNPEAEGKTE